MSTYRLKTTVREFLKARKCYWYHPHNNGGRFVIPKAAFRDYIKRLETSESELQFVRLSLARYIPVLSLLALWWLAPTVKQLHFPS